MVVLQLFLLSHQQAVGGGGSNLNQPHGSGVAGGSGGAVETDFQVHMQTNGLGTGNTLT